MHALTESTARKSVLADVLDIQLAQTLIRLGARMQLLEAETMLSRDRLVKLYQEVKGAPPPKGMLPCSPDWFMNAQPNIHSSLFFAIYRKVRPHVDEDAHRATLHALIKSYGLYLETIQCQGDEAVLSFTRAWTLPRFFERGVLHLNDCAKCHGRFVALARDVSTDFVCAFCRERMGKD
jgi:flagellar transcriptional activator FlhC